MITDLEPDILECEVKWALGSINTNKASGVDEIPFELFQILKGDTLKVLHSICQQIWKTQPWPQAWKRSVFYSNPKEKQRQRMFKLPKNCIYLTQDFLGGLDGKASVYNVGNLGSIPGSGRSPGEENGNPLQYYCLENPMDKGAWQTTVHGVRKSRTRLSDFTSHASKFVTYFYINYIILNMYKYYKIL